MKIMNQWVPIAENYEVERDNLSLPAILVDDLIMELADKGPQGSVLDFGSGSGTLSRLFAERGRKVTAFEPNAPMRDIMIKITAPDLMQLITSLSDLQQLENCEKHDTILCVNVVDHILDVPAIFKLFREKIKDDGNFLLCIPHPLKNLGKWIKEKNGEVWDYLYYRLDDYMKEGTVKRDREDVNGNPIIKDVVSQHRTISTYYNWVIEAGFNVLKMYEPAPKPEHEKAFAAHYNQSSRIPYFWILDCKPV